MHHARNPSTNPAIAPNGTKLYFHVSILSNCLPKACQAGLSGCTDEWYDMTISTRLLILGTHGNPGRQAVLLQGDSYLRSWAPPKSIIIWVTYETSRGITVSCEDLWCWPLQSQLNLSIELSLDCLMKHLLERSTQIYTNQINGGWQTAIKYRGNGWIMMDHASYQDYIG